MTADQGNGGGGFGRLLLAEWTKLRTIRGTVWCLLAAAGVMVLFPVVVSSGSPGTYRDSAYVDEFRFVHRPLTGDGALVARVRTQERTHPWAMAGLMVKAGTAAGAPYAAVLVTPGHGVRMQAQFTTDLAGGAGEAPRWLKLVRDGDAVTGYESVDGTNWTVVGTVRLAGLPPTVEAGLFVTSPGLTRIVPMRPTMLQTRPGTATFDEVRLTPNPPDAGWRGTDVGLPDRPGRADPGGPDPAGGFTLTGSGDIIGQRDDGSRVVAATAGTVFGVLPVVALGALVMTSEYRRNLIRTTLAASPRRGRVLVAKAIVTAGATFTTGALAVLAGLLLSQPLLRRSGYRPPTYPDPSLSDPAVLRVVAGTAGFLALLALLSLGLGAVLRHSAGAITALAAAVLVPVLVVPFLPADAGGWLQRLAPVAGLSVQQVRETDDVLLVPWTGRPWAGLAVLAGYAGVALAAGAWLLRRRDA